MNERFMQKHDEGLGDLQVREPQRGWVEVSSWIRYLSMSGK